MPAFYVDHDAYVRMFGACPGVHRGEGLRAALRYFVATVRCSGAA